MTSTLAEALAARELDAVIELIQDNPHQGQAAGQVLEAWAWASTRPEAPRFAAALLRVLSTSYPKFEVPRGWVDATGLALAEQAMREVDDADGPTIIYGTLLTLDATHEWALEHWLEAVIDGDGYFYPESLYKAYEASYSPKVPAERRAELRAIELLASFSLTTQYASRGKACEYLARDRGSKVAPVSLADLQRARERLAKLGAFELPSDEELAAS